MQLKTKNDKQAIFEMIYEVVKQIPRGRVTTYGAIAEYLDNCSPRVVGWAMNQSHFSNAIPAHRVVNRKGELTGRNHFGSPTMMQELLEQEGIYIQNNTVQDFLTKCWNPNEALKAP